MTGMTGFFPAAQPRPQELAEPTIALVRKWLESSRTYRTTTKPGLLDSAALLAEVLKDPGGLDFTIGFVDRVIRPEDEAVAAHHLALLARQSPRFLPPWAKLALRAGGLSAPFAPKLVIPVARAVLRQLVGHLIVDARPQQLGRTLAALRGHQTRLNINLLGEAVLGEKEANARLAGTRALLERDDVDYVSIKVSSVVPHISLWAFGEAVDEVVRRLTPLYQYAAGAGRPKFINLDMEEYHDLDLTVAVFTKLLDQPKLRSYEGGIVLQAYLPDALKVLQKLTSWAHRRHEAGGAGIKVRLVKGANLAMERVDAALHGWALATVGSKQEADTQYKRCLDWALRPEHTEAVRLGVAGHNLFDIALARVLGQARRVSEALEYEMLLGMAPEHAAAITADVGHLLLYTPVVHPEQFDVAISYLVRRLEENASEENFMSAAFDIAADSGLFEREKNRFLASLEQVDTQVLAPNRRQDPTRVPPMVPFTNATDSDPSLPHIRQWGREVLARVPGSSLGTSLVQSQAFTEAEQVDQLVSAARDAQKSWARRPASERAERVRAAGAQLAAQRGELIEVAASETGKILPQADVEVSEAVDCATYYSTLAEELETVAGARFTPATLTVVTPPWNFPLAITAGCILGPLAAGNAVIVKPAPQAKRCAAVITEALWKAGIPQEVLRLADVPEGPLGQQLIAHPGVDRVLLTGAYATAELFRSWRPDLQLLAETSGKNSMIVTPSADPDLAVRDIVASAFGHAGQKCSAASLVILVGSMARSQRFKRQLFDAVTGLQVGLPEDPAVDVGPLIGPPTEPLMSALTRLDLGESWVVKPRQLNREGRLYSPGVRAGIRPGSNFHTTEYFGPVLGIMVAKDLDEAIEFQNGTAYGLTAGLHTLDPAELARWFDRVQAGNLYVNRGITGAIIRRQPFGGWKRSSVGPGAKAGGPNYLVPLGEWEPTQLPSDRLEVPLSLSVKQAYACIRSELSQEDANWLRAALGDDEVQWAREFGVAKDASALGVERNIFRYRPAQVQVRAGSLASTRDIVRVMAAAFRAGSTVMLSCAVEPSRVLRTAVAHLGVTVQCESAQLWTDRVVAAGTDRVRLIGDKANSDYEQLLAVSEASPRIACYRGAVTAAGRVELLPFLLEQSVTITAHRFGNPDNISHTVLT